MYQEIIARKSNSDGRTQSLCEHMKNVSEISGFTSHYPNISKLIGYIHDFGKASTAFQDHIKNNSSENVIHSWQGAFLANDLFSETSIEARLLKEIIALCVTAHHNHLKDGVAPDGTTLFYDKLLLVNDKKYSYDEVKSNIPEELTTALQILFEKAKKEILEIKSKIQAVYQNLDSANFALGLFAKYLFSCLVDADRLDAYLFEVNEPYIYRNADWESLINIFEDNISKFPNTSKIDSIRRNVSEKCKAAADKGIGIYQLSVPTGGGKTLSTLRFALHHCKKYSKKRIIYVIPYLSIIEQTARNIRDILNLPEDNEIIFEHHSNIMEPEDEKTSIIRKLSVARWDSPIIITTMVQFMETVMSSKSSFLRKFASMADSVIIFDEIQTIPVKAVHCFNEVVTFLSKILHSTIVLCSATQPTLEDTQRKNLLLENNSKLIDCSDDFRDIKRVKVEVESEKDYESASSFILEKAEINGNCLVIVNEKRSAFEIYNRLKSRSAEFEVLHLSTSMCPMHRLQVIEQIKGNLKNHRKTICVSTQLIEAGVDISFSCVIRAMAGLDSIAQASGRCNRNGESLFPKTVYTFLLKDENLDMLNDIKSGQETALQILRNKPNGSNLLSEETMTEYYRRYFAPKGRQMDYPTANSDIYSMLAENKYGKENYRNRTGKSFSYLMAQAFYSADESFKMIDNNTKSIVVTFGESEKLIEEYRKLPTGIFSKEKIKIINKLQKYSVPLYEWQLKKLADQRAVYTLDEETGICILSKAYYSPDTGVVLNAVQENYLV